ncbi:cisd-1 [Pristionchus pacificus]|uniref:CDGSH iron-sulfur domain-containing protein 2 homologue n=1 Tax=Pristionchus pacificus TaxID=54126 RepID=A0A2A6CW24_PRIPA|nr:cisd-1 [Pristionchus pacificus]|eukprot:PDM82359.1 cisd-1 [Pristionchus pacificus]
MASAGLYGAALNHAHPHEVAPASLVSESAKMVCPNSGLSGPGCHSKLILGGIALVGVGAAIGYLVCKKASCCSSRVNNKIKLGEPKVADVVDLEDIGEKKAFCRCWKSEKWPYCDGSHGKHNKETGDNVGPVVIKKKE